jgi:Fe-S cluster assembly ATPase SufC
MSQPLLSVPDLGLSIGPGESAAVVGPGAQALWRRLAGAADRPRGPVLYKGEDISGWDAARRRQAGILALFERPRVTAGMTLAGLLRASAGRGLRASLRLSAERLRVPEALLDAPLDDPRWAPLAAEAEWLQAAVLSPALVVAAARPARAALDLLRERGAAVILTARQAA